LLKLPVSAITQNVYRLSLNFQVACNLSGVASALSEPERPIHCNAQTFNKYFSGHFYHDNEFYAEEGNERKKRSKV
jgi:hypothetical protein